MTSFCFLLISFCSLMVALIVVQIDCLVPMLQLENVVIHPQTLGIYEQI